MRARAHTFLLFEPKNEGLTPHAGLRIATKADDAARTAMVPIVQQMTVVFGKMTSTRAGVEHLPDEQQETAFAIAVIADADLQACTKEALGVCAVEKFDALRFDMRRDFFHLRLGFLDRAEGRAAALAGRPACVETPQSSYF